MVTINQSTTTNNSSFCLTISDFAPSSSFNFQSKKEKQPLFNKLNNLRQKRRERFYGEKKHDIRNRCLPSLTNVKTSSSLLEQSTKEFSSVSKDQIMASENENNYNLTLISSISSPHLPFFVSTPFNTQHFNHFLINKLFLFFIFIIISCLILPGSSTPINIEQPIILPVGSIFILEDNLANEISPRQQLPLWMRADLSIGKKRFFGIPQIRDVGKYNLMFLDGRKSLSLEVSELQPSPCPSGIAPIWLEVLDPREYQRLSMEEQLKLADSVLATLHKADATFVHRENFRIFPYIYLERYRTVNDEILSAPVIPNTSLAALVLNISCGELSEQATEVISAVADHGLVFRVVQGSLIKPKIIEQQIDNSEKIEENKLKSKEKETSSSSSLLIIGIILFLILILISSVLAFRWFRTKQQAKRRKQFLDANGNGTTRPSALNSKENSTKNIAVTALSPDASMKTLTTPMLEGNENCSTNEETKIINGNH